MKTKTYVIARLTVDGLHHWPEAEGEAEYLKHPHRHLFHITVHAPVEHADRDIEFIELKRDVQKWLEANYARYGKWRDDPQDSGQRIQQSRYLDFGTMSCEQIGRRLLEAFDCVSLVEVSEDGENGAVVLR